MLLLTELPQLASNPANPIRMRVNNRFMYRTYRIVIHVGLLVAVSALTKGGLIALIWPVFWLIANWKTLPEGVSSKYTALFAAATAVNEGVVQPLPQS